MDIKDRTLQKIRDDEFFKKELSDTDLRLLSNSINDFVADNLGANVAVSCIWNRNSGMSLTFKVRLTFDKEMNSDEWRKTKYDFLRGLYRTNFFRTTANPLSNLELKLTMLNKQYAKSEIQKTFSTSKDKAL